MLYDDDLLKFSIKRNVVFEWLNWFVKLTFFLVSHSSSPQFQSMLFFFFSFLVWFFLLLLVVVVVFCLRTKTWVLILLLCLCSPLALALGPLHVPLHTQHTEFSPSMSDMYTENNFSSKKVFLFLFTRLGHFTAFEQSIHLIQCQKASQCKIQT